MPPSEAGRGRVQQRWSDGRLMEVVAMDGACECGRLSDVQRAAAAPSRLLGGEGSPVSACPAARRAACAAFNRCAFESRTHSSPPIHTSPSDASAAHQSRRCSHSAPVACAPHQKPISAGRLVTQRSHGSRYLASLCDARACSIVSSARKTPAWRRCRVAGCWRAQRRGAYARCCCCAACPRCGRTTRWWTPSTPRTPARMSGTTIGPPSGSTRPTTSRTPPATTACSTTTYVAA